MSKFIALLLAFATCCGYPEPVQPRSDAALVREISGETVALVARIDDRVVPYCTGVWVSAGALLTAAHCVQAIAGDDDALGTFVVYIVQSEVTGNYTEPTTYHAAVVDKIDDAHDLARLRWVDLPPQHGVARLAERLPDPGDRLHCVGQDRGFYWTYVPGVMSREWTALDGTDPKIGPWMQVTAAVGRGMSGSGAFDDTGALVGILSMVANSTPDVAIYVHLDTVREFLADP